MSARDELLKALSPHAHLYDMDCGTDGGCACGAVDDYDESEQEHDEHLADALIAEGWRKMPSRDEVAAELANHFVTRGQQVASGVTCECGYWTGNEPEAGRRPLNWGHDRLGLHRADQILALMDRGQRMDEYTPSTEEILRYFVAPPYKVIPQHESEDFGEYLARASMETFQAQIASEQAARRWLAEHDREVAANAWDEGAMAGADYALNYSTVPSNPYRQKGQDDD